MISPPCWRRCPRRLTREEAVFRLPDVVERVSNATAGLLGREAAATAVERVMRHPEVVRADAHPPAPPRAARTWPIPGSTPRAARLRLEQALREMAAGMAAETGHGLPAQAIEEKIASLMERGYPLSEEQVHAIRAVAGAGGRVAIVEGAAGSGKTTTLRPIADLCQRARGHGDRHRRGVADGGGLGQRPRCPPLLRRQAAEARGEERRRDRRQDHHRGGRGGDAVYEAGASRPPARRAPRREGGVRRRHAAAAAGGGGSGLAADPRCGGQRPRRPHPAPAAGPRGHPGARPRRDAGGGALPGRADGRRRSVPASSRTTRRWRTSRPSRPGRSTCRKR